MTLEHAVKVMECVLHEQWIRSQQQNVDDMPCVLTTGIRQLMYLLLLEECKRKKFEVSTMFLSIWICNVTRSVARFAPSGASILYVLRIPFPLLHRSFLSNPLLFLHPLSYPTPPSPSWPPFIKWGSGSSPEKNFQIVYCCTCNSSQEQECDFQLRISS